MCTSRSVQPAVTKVRLWAVPGCGLIARELQPCERMAMGPHGPGRRIIRRHRISSPFWQLQMRSVRVVVAFAQRVAQARAISLISLQERVAGARREWGLSCAG